MVSVTFKEFKHDRRSLLLTIRASQPLPLFDKLYAKTILVI